MPPRQRSDSPKKAPAKKIAARDAQREGPRPPDPVKRQSSAMPLKASHGGEPPTGGHAELERLAPSAAAEAAGRVTGRSYTEDSHARITAVGDAVEVATTTNQHASTTIEYGPGHTVTETTTSSTVRVERIPDPYAGPVSDHPAPVG